MENKYDIKQKVICLGKRCIIIATKKHPYKSKNMDPYFNNIKIPEKDYLLYILNKIDENGDEHYSGTLDVYENQIEYTNW
ncbi:MAG: hypothetical protein JNM71_07710 [Flavobacterium lindanitolerans]|uniref:hypothetical protein n=1 Tax=Flavobacterium lindanitolerans TaxID=428988 RepID=UPI001A406554|nr:hypothetical protein [Flavobacterium lindanitolerans]MBL7867893.1 hypothetical protein [Flavobacterium lindanitolerans]